jgi:hypothetical protein
MQGVTIMKGLHFAYRPMQSGRGIKVQNKEKTH